MERLYRKLLVLYPEAYRREYGDAMVETFAQLASEAAAGGFASRIRFLAREIAGLVMSALGQRLGGWGAGRRAVGVRRGTSDSIAGTVLKNGPPDPRDRRPGTSRMETMALELRYAVRRLVQSPRFTVVALLTLALGIGANTAIFSVVDAVTLRPLPFDSAEEIVLVQGTHVRDGQSQLRGLSYPDFLDLRERVRALEGIVAADGMALNVMVDGAVRREPGARVSAGYFGLLGVEPVLGRSFRPEDDRVGAPPVAVVREGFFDEHFGGDPEHLGEDLVINERLHTVIGVVPGDFGGLNLNTRIWVPFEPTTEALFPGDLQNRSNRDFVGIGRLRDGTDLGALATELDGLGRRLAEAHPESNDSRGFEARKLREVYLGPVDDSLWILLGAVACLLLVACANVANLVLARAESRRTEIATRVALGAGPKRIATQVLLETVVLALLAGVAGLVAVSWSLDALVAYIPAGLLPGYVDIEVNLAVLIFSVGLAGVAGLGFGLGPALQASRADPARALQEGGRGTGRDLRRGLRAGLVVGQVALTVLLLVGAGLVARSLRAQMRIDPGFRADGVTALRLSLPVADYDTAARVGSFGDELVRALEARATVTGAALGSDLPMRGRSSAGMALFEGHGSTEDDLVRYYRHRVTPGFFDTLGIELIQGRRFDSRDTEDGRPVILVGESVARRFWPEEGALGKSIRAGGETWRIVGIVGDVRFRNLTDDLMASGNDPDIYFPLVQFPARTLELALRSRGTGEGMLEIVRREVARIDPRVPVANVARMERVLEQQTGLGLFASLLLGLFSGLALVLGSVGIYGVISYAVASRRRETGIRIALGAPSARIVREIVGQGLLLAGCGGLAGLLVAAVSTRYLAAVLYSVSPTDPATFALVLAFVLAVAAVACWLPARRAARTDPARALREE